MKAGIIAAGWGERLGKKTPKALTPVGNKALIDYALDGLEAAGATQVTCIINEAAVTVKEYVNSRRSAPAMDWIVRTTPSSMHSFLIVLDRLAQWPQSSYLMTTVDSVCAPEAYRRFAAASGLYPDADMVLGLTSVIDDEKPLRVAMRGRGETGLLPPRVEDDPEAFEIVALSNNGFDSEYVTSGFYRASPRVLNEKTVALEKNFTALRQYLGHLLKYGYRFYGVPLPPVMDVDRPQDIAAAEKMLQAEGRQATRRLAGPLASSGLRAPDALPRA